MAEVVSAVVALAISALMGFKVIPWLKKMKYGQSIKEIGPAWHKDKEGTPTMGGVMFITGFTVALILGVLLLCYAGENWSERGFSIVAGTVICFLFSAIGFADDIVKIKEHHNDGLTPKQKLVFQIIIAAVYTWAMNKWGGLSTRIDIPFIGNFDFGWFYYALMVFSIVGVVNAVNLTDGLDGLASSVTLVVSIGFTVIAYMMGRKLNAVFSLSLAGALIGFLIWNFKPAKVFMGDTGSMFLGGAVVAMAFGVDYPLLMLLAGILYVGEAFSVMLQVGYFKLTHGKRIFKMSPIHHHFELCGWSEEKIILVFSIVAAVGTALSVWAASVR